MSTSRILAEFKAARKLRDRPAEEWVNELIEFLTVKGLKIGGTYRHFKGTEYSVYKLVGETIYYRDDMGNEWDRPLEEFLGNVETPSFKGARFTLIR